jgi:hypothetical protein
MSLKHLGGDGSQVLRQAKTSFHSLDRLFARIAVSFWCELQEPLIELVNRSPCVSFPEMGFVGIDSH